MSTRNGSGKTKNGTSSKLAASLSKDIGAPGSNRNPASFAASRKNTVDNLPEETKRKPSRKVGETTPSELQARMSERQSETNKRDKKREQKLERSDRKEKEKKDDQPFQKMPKTNYVLPG